MTETPKLDARVRLTRGNKEPSSLLGFADLVIADSFVIKDVRIVMGRGLESGKPEPFVAFPSRRGTGTQQERWFDVAHPITAEARKAASAVVLARYREAAEGCVQP